MKIMKSIPVIVPDERIYMRLGRYKHFTEIPPARKRHIDLAIAEAKSKCRPAAAWDVAEIAGRRGPEVVIEGGDVFCSAKLSELLHDSSGVLLFAATAGAEICAALHEASPADAAIYDAVGSETADAAAAWVQDYAGQELRRRGLAVSDRRFSPGYGGLSLSVQQVFFRRLCLAELGMSLTPSFFMIPEKSVTALAGLSRPAGS